MLVFSSICLERPAMTAKIAAISEMLKRNLRTVSVGTTTGGHLLVLTKGRRPIRSMRNQVIKLAKKNQVNRKPDMREASWSLKPMELKIVPA